MSLIDSVALTSLRGLPSSIQSRIFLDKKFQKEVEINGGLAPFDDAGRIRLGDLLDATRQVYEKNEPHTIRNLDGAPVQLEMHERRVVITRVGDEVCNEKTTPFELALLSPDAQVRMDALNLMTKKFSVTGPLASHWQPILEQRPPSNDEVSLIHDAIGQSVPNWWAIAQDKISSNQLTPADLVPTHAEYFTALCGPLPNGMDVNAYVAGPLQAHRKEIVAEDLVEGLSLSLPASLRADASVVPALEELSDDELWETITRLQDMPDPYTLLGLVEIALARRTTKPEFEALASSLIEKLCAEALPRHDGMDVYDIFPALVDLSLRHLRHIDGMMTQPAYWHWLCAFTHAGLLTRLLDGLEFDPTEMSKWFATARENSYGLADILALRREPTWRFDLISRERIQAEIIGRLKGLAQKEEAKGREFPNGDLLNKRVEEYMKHGMSPFRPGPLEGNLRPKDLGAERTLPDEEVDNIIAKLREAPDEIPWSGLDNASAVFFLPDQLRIALTDALPTIELPEGTFAERTNSLATAALVAGTHLDRVMAEAITERLFQEFNGEDDTQTAFLVILMASAAIKDEEWVDWLTDRLYRLALLSPTGMPLRVLDTLISELKTLLPVGQWRLGRVEALCKNSF